jgi:ABC-2 type transport system permease protein
MSAMGVFRKDFLDVRRAKIVWFVCGIYTLLFGLFFYFNRTATAGPGGAEPILQPFAGVFTTGVLVLPLVALVAAYLSIAGERESGSIKYLLSLPNSRADVVLGKFLSRSIVVAGAVVFAFLVAAVFGLVWYPSLAPAVFARMFVLTLLYLLAYVSIAIGLSAATASRSRAIGGSIGVYFVTVLLLIVGLINEILEYLLNDLLALDLSSEALLFVQAVVSPTVAYGQLQDWAFGGQVETPAQAATPDVWYLSSEMMGAVLVGWVVVPLVVGYLVFRQSDLG